MFDISVIIPAYNEKRHLKSLFDSLQAQTINHDDFEVIIVDNVSTDRTLEYAEKIKTNYDFSIKVLNEQHKGANYARNKGGFSASGNTLIFLDADNTVEPNFLSDTLSLTKYGYNAGSYFTKPNTKVWYDRLLFWGLHLIKKVFNKSFGKSFVAKDIFNRIGGFDNSNALGMNVRFANRVRNDAATKYVVCEIPVYASMRRFHRHGYLKTLWSWLGGYIGYSKKELTRQH